MIITVFNQKGGVAKTTTAVHLTRAAVLCNKKARPLLVDVDEQRAVAHYAKSLKHCCVEAMPSMNAALFLREAKSDLALLDCPPSYLDARPVLAVADLILIPMLPEPLALAASLNTVEKLQAEFPRTPIRVLLTMTTSAADNRECRKDAQKVFGELLLPVAIVRHRSIRQASDEGKTVFDFAPDSPVAKQYLKVLQLLIQPPEKR